MAVQRHERQAYYHLPVHCGFCGHLVDGLDDFEPVGEPCRHTLYVAHDQGFTFISDRAEKALANMSCKVIRHDDDYLEVECGDDDERNIDELTDALEFPDALKVASYVGPPDGSGIYIGFAPTDDE
jgi:hypothetical protein